MKEFSLKEAAELAGVSKVTLWRFVQRGNLQARKEEHQGKTRYRISAETFHDWLETFQGVSHPSRMEDLKHLLIDLEHPPATSNPSLETSLETFQPRLETMDMVPVELHRLALEAARNSANVAKLSHERAERYERQLENVSGQLLQYRQALTEQAESLAQKESRQKHLELLAEENARNLKLYEETKNQILEELQLSKQRVAWLEKRVPKWIRKMLGAG